MRVLELHATVMRLESEIRCMKAAEDAWLAATWGAWDRVEQWRRFVHLGESAELL